MRLNHSCEPNVRLLPAGPKQLLVVAAVDIREGEAFAWETKRRENRTKKGRGS